MKIKGKNRKGRPQNTCSPRKRKEPTKAEKRLQKRIEGYNDTMRVLGGRIPEHSYHRPGSLKYS